MKRLMLCVSVLALAVSGCASAAKEVAAKGVSTATSEDLYCVRGQRNLQAFPQVGWQACGDMEFDFFEPYTHNCTAVQLDKETDRFRVYFKGDDLRLDIDSRDERARVQGLSLLPTFNKNKNVVYYQGAVNGVHYYLYQKPEESPARGYWYVEIFDTEKMAPDCDTHRISAPDEVSPGLCPARDVPDTYAAQRGDTAGLVAPAAVPQGATGGGGGNKPTGLANAGCR